MLSYSHKEEKPKIKIHTKPEHKHNKDIIQSYGTKSQRRVSSTAYNVGSTNYPVKKKMYPDLNFGQTSFKGFLRSQATEDVDGKGKKAKANGR